MLQLSINLFFSLEADNLNQPLLADQGFWVISLVLEEVHLRWFRFPKLSGYQLKRARVWRFWVHSHDAVGKFAWTWHLRTKRCRQWRALLFSSIRIALVLYQVLHFKWVLYSHHSLWIRPWLWVQRVQFSEWNRWIIFKLLSRTMWISSTLLALCTQMYCFQKMDSWTRGSSWPHGRKFQLPMRCSTICLEFMGQQIALLPRWRLTIFTQLLRGMLRGRICCIKVSNWQIIFGCCLSWNFNREILMQHWVWKRDPWKYHQWFSQLMKVLYDLSSKDSSLLRLISQTFYLAAFHPLSMFEPAFPVSRSLRYTSYKINHPGSWGSAG